ncbi:MAG: DsbA family protein [Pseudomonadota bacterium]
MTINKREFVKLSLAGAAICALSGPAFAVDGLYDELPLPEKFVGKEDAPVTVVEYASMTCPHCKSFHERIYPKLKEKYVDSGKVKFIMREFAWDDRAKAAFMLARCAPNDAYFPMVDVLFKQQNVWATSRDPAGELLKISKLAGFTEASFRECLTNQKLLDGINAVKNRGERKFGVNATPTLFINEERFSGDMTVDGISAAIDALL